MAGMNRDTLQPEHVAARERFKLRLQLNGVGGCGTGAAVGCGCDGCAHALPAVEGAAVDAPAALVAGVRFRDSGKTYFVDASDFELTKGERVVVDSSRGREIGEVVIAPQPMVTSLLEGELRPVLRIATADDLAAAEQISARQGEAMRVLARKIGEHKLPMKPISSEWSIDSSRVTFYFSANGRVDFRELVRDLAAHFHCRIELRQVGPRDEARLLGGLGRCGRPLCCSTWLPQFADVSMTMAKTQDLPHNPGKLSGVCGKLLCCLSYENDQYVEMRSVLPRLGQEVETPKGRGYVSVLHLLKELVTVRLETNEDGQFSPNELTILAPAPDAHAGRRRKPRRDSSDRRPSDE
jgi:cell fate regulator YaaT (PSP1 superfamily)